MGGESERSEAGSKWFETLALWVSVPLFLVAWQAASISGYVNELLFPPPTKVAVALWDELVRGTLLLDLSMSVMRVAIGFASGAAAGILVGLVTGRYQVVSNLLTPIFQLLRPIPPIAFVPIVILWFGLSEWGKWFLVFWGVFFTVWVATHLGVQRADPALIRAARSLGTPDRLLIRDVILPSALPTIFVGLRTAVSISFYTLVAAELAGAFAGLAYRIDLAHQNMQTGQMLGGLVMLGIVSAAADRGFALLSRRLVWWS
jgi:ABC-type nitrate/sulfonate/bicarbonate transport system permease component